MSFTQPPSTEMAASLVDPRVTRTRHDVLEVVIRLLADDGAYAVTHANVAREAGYSKATLYKHWPTRSDLLTDALERVGEVEHHTPTGDLRADLIAEVTVYRDEMKLHQLDKILAVLAGLITTNPELVTVRDTLVRDGERVVRELLAPHLQGNQLDAAALMLVGGVLQSALLHGSLPSDEVIAASVGFVLKPLRLTPDTLTRSQE